MLALLKERGYVAADTKSVSSTVSKIYIEEIEKELAQKAARRSGARCPRRPPRRPRPTRPPRPRSTGAPSACSSRPPRMSPASARPSPWQRPGPPRVRPRPPWPRRRRPPPPRPVAPHRMAPLSPCQRPVRRPQRRLPAAPPPRAVAAPCGPRGRGAEAGSRPASASRPRPDLPAAAAADDCRRLRRPPVVTLEGDVKIIHLKPPVIVRDFAVALSLKPFKLISELNQMGGFASMNSTIDEAVAQKVAEKYGFVLDIKHRGDVAAAAGEGEGQGQAGRRRVQGHGAQAPGRRASSATSTTARPRSWTPSARRTSQRARPAESPSTSAPTRSSTTAGRSPSSTPRATRRSTRCARAGPRSPTSQSWWSRPTTDSCPRPTRRWSMRATPRSCTIVAVNKMDVKGANLDQVKAQMQQRGIVPEDWGGETITVPVSAIKGTGINDLLEMILLQADVLELKANPKAEAAGVVIESQVDVGRGPLSTVIVQKGHPANGRRHRVRGAVGQGARDVRRPGPPHQGGAALDAGARDRLVRDTRQRGPVPGGQERQGGGEPRRGGGASPQEGGYDRRLGPEGHFGRAPLRQHRGDPAEGAQGHRQGRRLRVGRGGQATPRGHQEHEGLPRDRVDRRGARHKERRHHGCGRG